MNKEQIKDEGIYPEDNKDLMEEIVKNFKDKAYEEFNNKEDTETIKFKEPKKIMVKNLEKNKKKCNKYEDDLSKEEIDVRDIRIKVIVTKDEKDGYTVKLQDPLSGEFVVCDKVEVEEPEKEPTEEEINEFLKKLGHNPDKVDSEVRKKCIKALKK